MTESSQCLEERPFYIKVKMKQLKLSCYNLY